MASAQTSTYTLFGDSRRCADGELAAVALALRGLQDQDPALDFLIFDDQTGEQVDVDLGRTSEEIVERLRPSGTESTAGEDPPGESAGPRGPGRPRLGVVAHEVTLLPRHWEWLKDQPGGASVALRKLVEQARKANEGADRVRRSREAAYRFMVAMAGNLPGFEEASRALFAGSREPLESEIHAWPPDVRAYLLRLADLGLASASTPAGEIE